MAGFQESPLPVFSIATAALRSYHCARYCTGFNLFTRLHAFRFRRFLREGERNRVKVVVFFVDLVGREDSAVEQVRNEALDKLADAPFLRRRGIFETAFLKHVGEGDRGRHFLGMSDDFHNTAHDVMFEFNVQRRVVLSGNVENPSVVSEDLIAFHRGYGQKRRFSSEVDDGSPLTVNETFADFGGNDVVRNSDGVTFVVAELYAGVMQIDVEMKVHELFKAVHNGGELVFAGREIMLPNFPCQAAINDGRRKTTFIGVPRGNTNRGNVKIELIERFHERWISGGNNRINGQLDWRFDFTETLMILHLDDSNSVRVVDDIGVIRLGELEERFGVAVIGNNNFASRIQLNVLHGKFIHTCNLLISILFG